MSTLETKPARTARETVHAFIAAWNAHSPLAVREVFAPDGRLRDPAHPDGVTGPAIAACVQGTLDRIPDVTFRLGPVLEADGGRVAFEWHMSGTLAAPDGRRIPVTLEGCDVCEVAGGRITSLRGYFDRAAIARLLAGEPAPGAATPRT